MAHVSEAKKVELGKVKDLLNSAEKVGIIDLTSLPSAQFQKIKSKLKKNFKIRVTKKALIKLALESVKDKKQNIEQLEKYIDQGIPALLVTQEDPFRVSSLIKKNQSESSAKPGQICPRDLEVKAGPTSFSPGPIIGELGQAGIKAAIEGGKVVIKQDVKIAKEGDVFTQKQTDLLAKFDIKPMSIGLNLLAMYDNSQIFDKEVLSIDEETYFNNFKTASSEALNLAMFIAYPTKETVELLVHKAESEALALNKFNDSKQDTSKETTSEDSTQEAPKEEQPVEDSKEQETTQENQSEQNTQGG